MPAPLLLECFFSFSSNSRTFSIAIAAWSAKVFKSSTCRSGSSPPERGRPQSPDGNAVAQYRDAHDTAVAPDHACAKHVIGVRVDIRNLHETSLEYRARRRAPPAWRCGIRASVHLEHLGGEAVVRHEVEELAVEPVDKAELALAEPRRALGNHVEHRLDVGRRTADDVEHLASRGLVFKSLS